MYYNTINVDLMKILKKDEGIGLLSTVNDEYCFDIQYVQICF